VQVIRIRAAFALVLLSAATVLLACGGRDDAPLPVQASGADAAAEAADALPPGVAYVVGAYQCCEEGLGFACCTSDQGCGAYRACSPLGGYASGKLICSRCCAGLKLIFRTTVVDGGCAPSTTQDDNFCAACGDGTCRADEGEDACNCPEDCR
jgi:hypothetical protein